jgi:dihydrofolate reductase
MRKLIVCNFMTVDGYYEGKDRDIVSLFDYYPAEYAGDQTFDTYNADLLRGSDTLLLAGRTSFMGNKKYWSGVPSDPNATPIRREFAKLIAGTPKVVVSDKLMPEDLAPWADNTRIVRIADTVKEIGALKEQNGNPSLVQLSRVMWQNLLVNGLVDELQLTIFPIIGGHGVRMFDSQPGVTLKLLEARSWHGSGNVLIRYGVTKK